jgi:pSer/pThr/pTyr-binding forkhead associated (FHA) protein
VRDYNGEMLALLALFGPKQGLRIPLVGRLTLGRGATADLQLVDGKVSREHCRIDATGARAMIEDLGSQNGTYVNGEVISSPTPVAEGDEIMVGDTLLLVAGDQIEVANARYGAGTLLVSPQGRASTAANPGAPLPGQDSVRDGMRGLGALAARLATAGNEEDAATAVLDASRERACAQARDLAAACVAGAAAPSKERVVAWPRAARARWFRFRARCSNGPPRRNGGFWSRTPWTAASCAACAAWSCTACVR